jgi:hypothetical protein
MDTQVGEIIGMAVFWAGLVLAGIWHVRRMARLENEDLEAIRKTLPSDPKEAVVQLLDDIMLTAGHFNYDTAMARLLEMRESGDINLEEYVNLVDACNHRNDTGNYENSAIYRRAANQRD